MRAGDVLVTRKDRVVEELVPKSGLFRIVLDEIGVRERARQVQGLAGKNRCGQQEGKKMRYAMLAACLATSAGAASIEEGRDLMEAGKFQEAYAAFWPAARSGNADAEELIGVMYAMGLGVARDDQRAFEWYLRSAMKGHPGAQSGVGWYYEIGRGLPAPDLVRAYMWYTLSAIGGDPDAAISLEEVVKKMTAEEIAQAQLLVDDYQVWMYPFR